MSESARVESIDALKHFRIALFKFMEGANAAMNDSDSEIRQTLNWLENEQYSYWQGQIKKRHTAVEKCKEAVRLKQIFKDSVGRTPSAVDEEKALRLAQVQLLEAEAKFANTKKYARVLMKEFEVYKGTAQRFVTTLQVDLPQAVSALDGMLVSLEAYVTLVPTGDMGARHRRLRVAPRRRRRNRRGKEHEPMGLHEGRGTLAKALKQLEGRWLETVAEWDDIRAREFEQRFLFPLKVDLNSAVSAMDHMAVLISRIQRECE